jgi:hypothetical protein
MNVVQWRRTVDRLPRALSLLFACGLFAWGAVRTFNNIDQDAWIYFTYFKRFFDLPFSFQPGNVSYGATSPLHVILMAPIYHAGGGIWLPVAKALNFGLLFISLVLAHRAARVSIFWLAAIVAAALAFEGLFQATAALFETGVTCLAVSLLVTFVSRRQLPAALAVAGILPLARPELLLVSAAVVIYLACTADRARIVRLVPLVVAPTALYSLYMWLSGDGLIPSSIIGRAIIAREYQAPWLETMRLILADRGTRPYLVFLMVAAVASVVRPRVMWPAWLVITPIVALYLLRPPAPAYTARYLVPIVPALVYSAAVVLHSCIDAVTTSVRPLRVRRILGAATMLCSLIGAWVLVPAGPRFSAYTPAMILQQDLAAAVSGVVRPEDKVLMYEIQGQFYFPGFGISADGIVGSAAHAFLLRRETFDQFVDRVGLRFIVTFNGFNYRPVFKGTPLVDLYAHDLIAPVGDDVCLGRHCYQKIVTNPHFSEWYEVRPIAGLNTGSTLRFYGGHPYPELRGHLIQWNSVYSITDNDSARPLVAGSPRSHDGD